MSDQRLTSWTHESVTTLSSAGISDLLNPSSVVVVAQIELETYRARTYTTHSYLTAQIKLNEHNRRERISLIYKV